MSRRQGSPRGAGQLRIIGGQWRRRRVPFDPALGVRATPDRVRETLFNWLMPWIEGARCLDLFAGSGALGLEALSRGAERVCFIDREPRNLARIGEALDLFGARDRALLRTGDALGLLAGTPTDHYDIVFMDPPYAAGTHAEVLEACRPWLRPRHRVYLEASATRMPTLPEGWRSLRNGRAGQVSYVLLTGETEGAE